MMGERHAKVAHIERAAAGRASHEVIRLRRLDRLASPRIDQLPYTSRAGLTPDRLPWASTFRHARRRDRARIIHHPHLEIQVRPTAEPHSKTTARAMNSATARSSP